MVAKRHGNSQLNKVSSASKLKSRDQRQRVIAANAALSKLIQKHRKENGLSIRELSELSKLSPQKLQSIESGNEAVGLNDLHTLSNLLNISPSAIFEILEA